MAGENKRKRVVLSIDAKLEILSKLEKGKSVTSENQPECTSADLLFLKRLRDNAAKKRFSYLKQTKLDSFFK